MGPSDQPAADSLPGAIAITGMSGRFAGAASTDELWRLLARGGEGIVDLTDDDLRAAGRTEVELTDPDLVRRSGDLHDVRHFDATRFGIAASEAALIDPQIRHLLELSWEALESGAHPLDELRDGIGVYVGVGYNTYLARNLLTHPDLLRDIGWFGLRHLGNDKDFAATTVAYRLDLRGPALSVQTACSTSLTAVHLAVQALLGFECDLAVAGAATIEVPERAGYHYVAGEVLSADGYCRPFDAGATGTVLTSGAGVVTLRRYDDAVADGDPILAVIRGTALNNDGQRKVSYYAPSVEGQVAVVKEALSVAGVPADSVSLIEAHGTGTALGDPIEVTSLAEAMATSRRAAAGASPLVIGSVKANIGHTDTASGVAGLIKVVESLRHRTITPQLHFREPNPLLSLDGSGIRIARELEPWDAAAPRRAGITSLGVGGTNAHVVVEEFVDPEEGPEAGGEPQLLVVSAPSAAGVRALATRLGDALVDRAPVPPRLDRAAATLAFGRTTLPWRAAVAARTGAEAQARLGEVDPRPAATDRPRVLFLFPGAGPQRSGMIADLLRGTDPRFAAFRDAAEEALALVTGELGLAELGDLLRSDRDEATDARFRDPVVGLPALFVAEHALARQLVAWGVAPDGVLGHSMGEHAAAAAAGAATVRDAVIGIGARAEAIGRAATGGSVMTAVFATTADVERFVGPDLDLAVINAPDELVYSGALDAIAAFEDRLRGAGIELRRVNLAAAAHYRGLDAHLPTFRDRMATTTQGRPDVAFYSTQAGARVDRPLDVAYWADELRGTVRFADALHAAAADGPFVGVELAPGKVLTAAVSALRPDALTLPALGVEGDGPAGLLQLAGRLWSVGVELDLSPLIGRSARRVHLPVARLEGPPAWIEATRPASAATATTTPTTPTAAAAPAEPPGTVVLRAPQWQPVTPRADAALSGPWLLDADTDDPFTADVVAALRARGAEPVAPGAGAPAPVGALVVVRSDAPDTVATAEAITGRAIGAANALFDAGSPVGRLVVVTTGAWGSGGAGSGGAAAHPMRAAAAGVPSVLAAEYPGLSGVAIDVAGAPDATALADAALDATLGPVVQVSGSVVRTRTWAPSAAGASASGDRDLAGTDALVLGGLGHVGAAHAEGLLARGCRRVVVTTRRPLPDPDWLDDHGPGDPDALRLRRLQRLQACAARVGASVEVAVLDLESDRDRDPDGAGDRALDDLLAGNTFAAIVHAVGTLHDRLLAQTSAADVAAVVRAKLHSAARVCRVAAEQPGTLVVLVGSASTTLGLPGQAGYVAANSVIEALPGATSAAVGSSVHTVAWGRFADGGMAAEAAPDHGVVETGGVAHPLFHRREVRADGTVVLRGAVTPASVWVLDEHRVAGRAVLPATAHVALMLAAVSQPGAADTAERLALRDVTIIEPLTAPDDVVTEVRAVLDPPDRTIRVVRIESRSLTETWTLHSQAIVEPAGPAEAGTAHRDPTTADVPSADAGELVDVLRQQRQTLSVGAHWDAKVRLAPDRRRGHVELTGANGGRAWLVHPAALDLAFAAGLEAGRPSGGFWVPVEVGSVELQQPVGKAFDIELELLDADPEMVRFDLRLVDDDGTLAVLRSCELRRVASLWLDDATGAAPPAGVTARHVVELVADHRATRAETLLVQIAAPRIAMPGTPPPSATATPATAAAMTASAAVEGASELDQLVTMWREVLGTDATAETDFFQAGGHSLLGLRLVARIRRELGGTSSLPMLVQAPTPAAFAALRSPGQAWDRSVATALRTETDTAAPDDSPAPMHMVHGAGGNVVGLRLLAQAFRRPRRFYGYQANWVVGGDADPTIAAMADRYAAKLQEVQPEGPFFLAGYSGGGVIALEMAERLVQLGREVLCVVLLDTVPPRGFNPPIKEKLRNAAGNLLRHGPVPLLPWVRSVVRRKVHHAPPAAEEIADISAEVAAELDFKRAYDLHHMSTYHVDVFLARAESEWPAYPPRYGLPAVVRGSFTVADAPGDHFSMIDPANLSRLAAVIETHIESIESDRRTKRT